MYTNNIPIMHGIETMDTDYPVKDYSLIIDSPYKLELPQTKSAIFVAADNGGISDHSSDERYFIVAIDNQTKKGKEEFEEWLRNNSIGFKPLLGKFNGTIEYSYILNARHWHLVRDSGFITNQTFVLYLWPFAYGYVRYGVDARAATMFSQRSDWKNDMGIFVAINDNELDQFDDLSYDFSTDRYYVVRKKEILHPAKWNNKQWEQWDQFDKENDNGL